MKTRRLAVPGVSFRGSRVQGGKGAGNFNNKKIWQKERQVKEKKRRTWLRKCLRN